MEDVVHVGCHAQAFELDALQPAAVFEVVVGRERGQVEHVVALDEARGGIRRGGRGRDVLVEGHVARLAPRVGEHAAVYVAGDVDVFDAVHERLVVEVAAHLIAQQQAQTDALDLAVEA